MVRDLLPRWLYKKNLEGITGGDRENEGHDAVFQLAKTVELEREDQEHANRGDQGGHEQHMLLLHPVRHQCRTEE